jgi:hypothetical protein
MFGGGGRHASAYVGLRLGRSRIWRKWFWPRLVCTHRGLRAARARRSYDGLSSRLQPNGCRAARTLGMVPHADIRVSPVLIGLSVAVLFCFALTPVATRGPRWLRPLAWFYAVLMFSNGMGHTVFTILGGTVPSVTFSRPAPGFYSSPFLFVGSVWLMMRLWQTASGFRHAAPA